MYAKQKQKALQGITNHVYLVVDASGSMYRLRNDVVKVINAQVEHLAKRSKELDQETRVSIYQFQNDVTCLFYDRDVLRLPTIDSLYDCNGQTALIDATIQALEDLLKLPELYSDHAHVMFVITDGEENASVHKAHELARKINGLPDNVTVGFLVPNQHGVFEMKKHGIATNNISVWSTTSQGVVEVGKVIRDATESFMVARSKGIRSTKNLFAIDTSNLTKDVLESTLNKLNYGQYTTLEVKDGDPLPIRDFVESRNLNYKLGIGYYQLTKRETIQGNKKIAVLDNKTKHVYTGPDARKLIGLPDYEVKVDPAAHPNYTLFVQSTSVNRKLVPGTKLLLIYL